MALDNVTSFLPFKDITNTCKRMQHSPTIGKITSVQWQKLAEAKDFKYVSIIYCVLESK